MLSIFLFIDGIQALTLIEFLVKNGSELVIEACRDKVYKVRSLENFNFYEGTVDRGSGVREKSKQIVELLGSNDMIREERAKANNLRNKFVGIGNDGSRGSTGSISQGSNYSGSGGGGSYGNQSDRGFGNSYSDSGGGGGGSDSYSSNSNSRDSRYGNDNDKYSNGGGSSNYSNGGGSDGRYRDEGTYPTETKKKTYDDEPEEEVKIKHKIKSSSKLSAPTSDTAIGGKLKLNIKKEGKLNINNSIPSSQPVAQEIDLLGGGETDFVPVPPSSAMLDPFSSHQPSPNNFGDFGTPQSSTQSQQQDFGFASFEAAPQAPPVPQYAPQIAPAFDHFAMNNTPPQAPKIQPQLQQQSMQYSQPPQQTPQQPQPNMMPQQPNMMSQQPNMMSQQGHNQFSSPMQSPQVPMQPMQQQYQPQQTMNNFKPPSVPQSPPSHQQQYQQHQQPQQHQQQQHQHQQQQHQQPQNQITRGIVKAPEPDYGDFEGSSPSVPSGSQVN
jgi:epsin